MKNQIILVICLLAALNGVFAQKNDSSRVYFDKAMEEKASKRLLVAIQNLEKSLKFDPQFVKAHLECGYLNLEMRKTDNAMANFKKVLELEPNNIAATTELINLYYTYHQFKQALDYASQCKNCSNLEWMVGMCNYKLGNFGNAIKILNKVVKNNPNDAEVNYALAKSNIEVENFNDAFNYYNKAVQLAPERNKWACELGNLYFSQSRYKDAVVYYNKAMQNGFPVTNDFNESLGYAYLFTPEFAKGEKLFEAVLENKPGNKTILAQVADAFYEQGNFEKSIYYWQRVIDVNAKDAEAIYQQGICYQKMGAKAKGQQLCDKAIDMDHSLASLRQKKFDMGL